MPHCAACSILIINKYMYIYIIPRTVSVVELSAVPISLTALQV